MNNLVFRVVVDGQVVDQSTSAFTAITSANTAKTINPDSNVAVVVLTAEEAGLTPDELAARPFVPSAEQQAAEALEGATK